MLSPFAQMWHTTRNVLLFNGIWMGLVFFINSVVSRCRPSPTPSPPLSGHPTRPRLYPDSPLPLHRWVTALVDGYVDRWILEQFVVWTWTIPMYILSLVLSLMW